MSIPLGTSGFRADVKNLRDPMIQLLSSREQRKILRGISQSANFLLIKIIFLSNENQKELYAGFLFTQAYQCSFYERKQGVFCTPISSYFMLAFLLLFCCWVFFCFVAFFSPFWNCFLNKSGFSKRQEDDLLIFYLYES